MLRDVIFSLFCTDLVVCSLGWSLHILQDPITFNQSLAWCESGLVTRRGGVPEVRWTSREEGSRPQESSDVTSTWESDLPGAPLIQDSAIREGSVLGLTPSCTLSQERTSQVFIGGGRIVFFFFTKRSTFSVDLTWFVKFICHLKVKMPFSKHLFKLTRPVRLESFKEKESLYLSFA